MSDTKARDTKLPPPSPKKIYHALRLVGWNILGIVLVLILGEVTLRLAGVRFTWLPLGGCSGCSFDRQLLWVRDGYSAKVAAQVGRQPMIVFMGDSCTESGRYPEFLASLIGDHNPERNFTWVKVGVRGWSSYQGLRQLERDVVPMRPRIVTIFYGWNDHWMNYGPEDKVVAEVYRKYPAPLFELSSDMRMAALFSRLILAFEFSITERHSRGPERVSLSDFSANLRQMVHIARDNGIIPILLTAPSSHRKGEEPHNLLKGWLNDLDDLIPLHQQYVQAVRNVASEEQAPLIDLYSEFNPLPQGDLARYFRKDGIHLRRKGDEKIAELIYNYLMDSGLYNRVVEPRSK